MRNGFIGIPNAKSGIRNGNTTIRKEFTHFRSDRSDGREDWTGTRRGWTALLFGQTNVRRGWTGTREELTSTRNDGIYRFSEFIGQDLSRVNVRSCGVEILIGVGCAALSNYERDGGFSADEESVFLPQGTRRFRKGRKVGFWLAAAFVQNILSFALFAFSFALFAVKCSANE